MTRETKIGLLVGLAFLLVVGILLSEHITGGNDRPAAPLADAGRGVRTGMSAPGVAADEPARIAEPTTPVPTEKDLTPKPATVQVTVTPPAPSGGSMTHVVVQDTTDTTTGDPTNNATNGNGGPAQIDAPSTTTRTVVSLKTPTDPFSNDPIAKVAAEHGEAIVPVSDKGATDGKANGAANTTAAREYHAQAGDTLSRLAARLPGGNTKANRDAIVKLNPTLQKDPNHVVSGHSYLLPSGDAAATVVTTTTTTTTSNKKPAAPAAPAVVVAKTPTPEGQRTYVVKAGDTLSKIASNELGSKNEVAIIRTLNADVLKGTDVIKVDMKLKLPAKVLASVSVN